MARVATINFFDQVDGDTFGPHTVNFFESDGATALDLSNTTPKIQIRKASYNGRVVETLTVGSGITWLDQVQGQLQFGNVTIDWGGKGDYYWDLQITYTATSRVRTYMRGVIQVIDDSTE